MLQNFLLQHCQNAEAQKKIQPAAMIYMYYKIAANLKQ